MKSKLSIQAILPKMLVIVATIAAAVAPFPAQTAQSPVEQTGSSTAGSSGINKNEPQAQAKTPDSQVAALTSEKISLFEKPATSANTLTARSLNEAVKRPSKQASGSGWEVAFTPYLYMTGLSGTIGARGQTAEVDLSFGDIFEHLNLGIMGTLEARKGRFITATDLMWIKLGEERDTPGTLFSSVKLGVNMFVFDPEVGYRVYEGKGGSFDVLGGVRVMSVENNVNFRAGLLPATDFSERKTWATPVIGAHGTLNLSPKFFLATKFDVGGGVGADFTGQFYGGAGYRIKPGIALIGGYRYLKTNYDSEAGFVFDTTMNGILIGAKFNF